MVRLFRVTIGTLIGLAALGGTLVFRAQNIPGGYQCLQFGDNFTAQSWLADIPGRRIISLPAAWPLHAAMPMDIGDSSQSQAIYSPGGRYIAWRSHPLDKDGSADIFSIEDTQTHEAHPLKVGAVLAWSWSPDASRIIYYWYTMQADGTAQYFLSGAKPDGGDQLTVLLPLPAGETLATVPLPTFGTWSADSVYFSLVFHIQDELDRVVILNAQSLETSGDVEAKASVAWSPQGHRYAYLTGTEAGDSVKVGSPDSRVETTLGSSIFSAYSDRALTWSPDNRYLTAAFSRQSDQSDSGQYYFDIFDTSSGNQWSGIPGPPIFLFVNESGQGYPLPPDIYWSPNSDAMIFIQPHPGGSSLDLVLADLRTQSLKTLAVNLQQLQLHSAPPMAAAPDRSRIAVPVYQNNKVNVLLAGFDSASSVTLSIDADLVYVLSWSPDSQFVAIHAQIGLDPASEQMRLVWSRADGSDQGGLAYRSGSILGWHEKPNGLLFFGGDDASWRLMLLKAETRQINTLLEQHGPSTILFSPDDWTLYPSPNGKTIFVAYEETHPPPGTVYSSAYLATWDGSSMQTLKSELQYASGAAWSPDGAAFAFFSSETDSDLSLEVHAADGTLLWRLDNAEFPNLAPADHWSLVWTQCT